MCRSRCSLNHESIILELLERVQNLEKEVKELKEGTSVKPIENMTGKTNTQLAREYIQQQKEEARTKGEGSIVLVAGNIQKAIGLKNRPVIICNAMKQLMTDKDEILFAPPSGNSTTVRIKYYL